jgi:biotin carboxylase
MARVAELHVLALSPLPQHTRHLWEHCVASIRSAEDLGCSGPVDIIVDACRAVRADAVTTLSEFALLAVSGAARALGMRHAGENAVRARDKRLMRSTWRDAGVPSPDFRVVSSLDQLRARLDDLHLPVLLKPAWGAGSIGVTVIERCDQAEAAWTTATHALRGAMDAGLGELTDLATPSDFLIEEVIRGSTEGWFEPGSGYGDYLSVEGIVEGGAYHPLCITTRLPTIPPFTELSNLAPCVLSEEKQRRIETVARNAVNALGLDTCGTHTELKLLADGSIQLIESAARLGGVNVAREMDAVFGVDPIELLTRALLGQSVDLPPHMLTEGHGAAGSLSIIATDSAGRPWAGGERIWDSRAVDWHGLLSAGSRIEAVPGLTIPDGSAMPRYGSANGARDYAGLFYLRASDAQTLVRDCYSVLDGLEAALRT